MKNLLEGLLGWLTPEASRVGVVYQVDNRRVRGERKAFQIEEIAKMWKNGMH